ncbi:MAG: hypothetical protein QF384_09300 [Alphaproteobacteria bacterium]|jgi:hypothetical protein|nr:hypothetical protein [Alphaproteobacteria bacterium]MDP6832989.1 hypothetical protein [Alphaproteobacteria bacterium]
MLLLILVLADLVLLQTIMNCSRIANLSLAAAQIASKTRISPKSRFRAPHRGRLSWPTTQSCTYLADGS